MATLDEIAKPSINDAGKVEAYRIIADNLTPEEKLVKPDYLMDPSEVDTMMTKSQKVNALAVLEPADDILVDVCGFVKIEPVGLCEGDKFLDLPARFLHCSGDAHII